MKAKWGPLVAILVLYLLLALLYSIIVPIFEAPDEPAHFLYANDLAAGKGLPILDYAKSATEYHQSPLYYWLVAGVLRWFDTSGYEQFTISNPHAAISDASTLGNKNAYRHNPDHEDWPFKGLSLAVHVSRLISVGLGMVTICATYGLALKLFSPASSPQQVRGKQQAVVVENTTNASRSLMAAAAAAVVAFNPQFLFISGALNNDNAVTALGSLTLWATVIYFDRPRSVGWLVLLGVLSGLASLTKTTGVAIIVLVLGVLIAKAIQQRLIGRLWLDAGIIILLTAIIGGWWYMRNALLYADPFLSRYISHRLGDNATAMTAVGILHRFEEGEISFWGTFGWLNITLPEWVYTLIRLWTRLSVVGLLVLSIRWLLGKRTHVDMRTLAISLAWTGLVAALLTQWIMVAGGLQGRLFFPAIAALGVLLIAGWTSLVPGRWQVWMAAIPAVGLAFLAVATPFFIIAPNYARPETLPSTDLPPNVTPVELTYADRVKLIGYHIVPSVALPGDLVDVILYWQVLDSIPGDFSVFVHLFGRDGHRIGTIDTYPGLGNFPTSQWETGQVIQDVYPVRIAPDAEAPTLVTVSVGWYDFYGSREGIHALDTLGNPTTTVGVFKLIPHTWPEPEPAHELTANFDDIITLLGYDIHFEATANAYTEAEVDSSLSKSLNITLFWQSKAQPTSDFTVFVHLIDTDGNIIAQMDRPLLNGDYPTSFWEPGEIVQDSFAVPLASVDRFEDKKVPGEYRLRLGLYHSDDGVRLPVLDKTGEVIADAVTSPNLVTLP